MAVEAVDLRDLVNFAGNFLTCSGANALAQLAGICFKRDDGGRWQQTCERVWSLCAQDVPERHDPAGGPRRVAFVGEPTPQRATPCATPSPNSRGHGVPDGSSALLPVRYCKLWREVFTAETF